MTQASSADWEFSIVLPLGAVANQLQKIEAQLRLLNMKALTFAREHDGHALHAVVEGRLEQIGDRLDSVAALVSDIRADISPRRANVTRLTIDEESPSSSTGRKVDDPERPRDAVRSAGSARKPLPDRDD